MKSLIKCFVVLWLAGCSASPALKLKSIDFTDLPDWEHDNTIEAYDALKKSCVAIETRYQPDLKNDIKSWQQVCSRFASIPRDEVSFRIFMEENFTPYSVKFKGKEDGVITGYYEASLYRITSYNVCYTKLLRLLGDPN